MQPGEFQISTSVLRSIEAEIVNFLASHAQEQLEDGRA
jgi:hypothetical protein